MLNAGTASFAAIDWFKLIVPLIMHPIITFTVVSYIVQRIGERSEDGFGYIWQCNVFGPYLFVSLLQLLKRSPLTFATVSRSAVSRATTSTRGLPLSIRRRLPLPLSRAMDDLPRGHALLPTRGLAARRNGPFLRIFEIPNRPCRLSARGPSTSVRGTDESAC